MVPVGDEEVETMAVAATRTQAPNTGARQAPPRPSTTTLKAVMALSGALFAVFVLVHMVGNLKIYFGPEGFNDYAAWLRSAFHPVLPYEGLLWLLRVVLLAALAAHIYAGVVLWSRGRAARGPHRRRGLSGFDAHAARSMLATGVVLAGFVLFHILDLTTGHAGGEGFKHAEHGTSHAYDNVVASFERPWSAAVYIVTMLVLFVHLAHGLWSVLHDVGVTARRTLSWWKVGAFVLALVVTVGNLSIPVAVLAGWVS